MADESGKGMFLVTLLITTLVVGGLVMLLKSDYRIDDITRSNEAYYPQISVEKSIE